MKPQLGLLQSDEMLLFTAYYSLTSGRVNLETDYNKRITQYYFFRKMPKYLGQYILAVGQEQFIAYVETIKNCNLFDLIEWLKETSGGDMSDEFLQYLDKFNFDGNIYGVPEGTPMFPNEPIMILEGKANDIQIMEDVLLSNMNFQSLIATKASRMRYVAGKRSFVGFGSRRAHHWGSALYGARAEYIGGTDGTSLVIAGKKWDIPYIGTIPHATIQLRQHPDKTFSESELETFMQYAGVFPKNTILLVDTYNSVNGIINSIAVGKWLRKQGHELKGIRLDSGNMIELSKIARTMLDNAGLSQVRIYASDSLDEYEITKLQEGGARIDGYGVGTRLATGANYNPITGRGGTSALGGVLKLSMIEDNPSMKFTDDNNKMTLPGNMQVWRVHSPDGMYYEDYISLRNEMMFGEDNKPLLVPYILGGVVVYKFPTTREIKSYATAELNKLKKGFRKIDATAPYPVNLSPKLRELKDSLISKYKKEFKQERTHDQSKVEALEKFMEVIDERNKIEERMKWDITHKWGDIH